MNPDYFPGLSLHAVFSLACLISLLAVALLLSKRLRQTWAAYSEKREAFYLPLILQAVTREAGEIPPSLFGAGRRFDLWESRPGSGGDPGRDDRCEDDDMEQPHPRKDIICERAGGKSCRVRHRRAAGPFPGPENFLRASSASWT